MSGQVQVTEDAVLIKNVECSDAGVVEYFSDLIDARRPEAVCRALSLGVTGLRSMNARADVDQVERGFEQLKREFEKAFDPERKNSYLGQLAESVDELLGEDGAVASVVNENGERMLKTLLEHYTQLRDVVMGQFATLAEREKGTAKGDDFESDVETILCRVARIHGDTVDHVAHVAGEAGASKRGDFVVRLAQGPVFTVESKNQTSRIILRGDEGILSVLDASMLNRHAEFGIAVSKCAEALPKEVGAFNTYDGDKLVCAFGEDGAMLEVAYRWARAQLLLELEEAETEVDVDAVRSSLADAMAAVNELAKIKAKSTAIIKCATDIQHTVEWQIARAKSALAQAEQGLAVEPESQAEAS